jgi:exodeoxyribonuclease VII large subunit
MTRTTEHVYTPSELNREIRLHLEMGFPRLLLEAEISNLSRPASGHMYFSLKDDKAQIRCALFRSSAARLAIQPENGMKVLARGRISLYEPRGEYQLIVDSLQDAGEGLLQRRFEELKKKLESEGLFDPAHKKELPAYPRRIALVTSPGGAAIRDILHVLERRWPVAAVRLYPVLVQGKEAPEQIRNAIESANRHGWAELLIAGRGGGSLEDLVAFNDEAVARSLYESGIPVVSAVGHETDFSICDFVADLRAPTPSAAAELATPDQAVLNESFRRAGRQLQRRIQDRLHRDTQGLDHLTHRLAQRHPASRLQEQARQLDSSRSSLYRSVRRLLLDRGLELTNISRRIAYHQPGRKLEELIARVDSAKKAMNQLAQNNVRVKQEKLRELTRTLNAVSPLETISRGYAVIHDPRTGEIISSVSQVAAGDDIVAQVKDGRIFSKVKSTRSD